jgi:hypothetical protein
MLMGVAAAAGPEEYPSRGKVMLGKTGRFVRSFASLPAPATSQPNSSGRRAQAYRRRDVECAVFFECCLAVVRRSNQHLLIAHEL